MSSYLEWVSSTFSTPFKRKSRAHNQARNPFSRHRRCTLPMTQDCWIEVIRNYTTIVFWVDLWAKNMDLINNLFAKIDFFSTNISFVFPNALWDKSSYGNPMTKHSSRDKTSSLIEEKKFCPHLERDVICHVKLYQTCTCQAWRSKYRIIRVTFSTTSTRGGCQHGFCNWISYDSTKLRFTTLQISCGGSWQIIQAHIVSCVSCNRSIDASHIAALYFQEIMCQHEIPKTITSHQDVKFPSHFWCTLRQKLALNFNLVQHVIPKQMVKQNLWIEALEIFCEALLVNIYIKGTWY